MSEIRHQCQISDIRGLTPTLTVGPSSWSSAVNRGCLLTVCTLFIGMMVAHNSEIVGVWVRSTGRWEQGRPVTRLRTGRYVYNSGLQRKARVAVLRISVEENGRDLSLILEGRLVGPWVDELQRVCGDLGPPANYGRLTVDLCGVTAMDASGQALLDRLLQCGATFRCSDVMNQYWVEQMAQPAKRLPEACRPCRSDSSGGPEETALASS